MSGPVMVLDPFAGSSDPVRYSVPLDGKELSLGPFPFRPRSLILMNQTTQLLQVFDDRGEEYDAAQLIAAVYGCGDSLRFRAKLDAAPNPVAGKATVIVSPEPAQVSTAQLSSFAAITPATNPVTQLAYNEQTVTQVVNAVTQATANQLVAASSVAVDGTFPITVEAGIGRMQPFGGNRTQFELFEDGVFHSTLGDNLQSSGLDEVVVRLLRQFTPSSGNHVYSLRAWQSAAGGANANAAATMPIWIRVLKVLT